MSDTWGEYRLSCGHLAYPSPTLNSSIYSSRPRHRSLVAFVSSSSLSALAYARLPFTCLSLFDEMLHSGTYVGIRRRSQTVIGGCFSGLLISTWSASQLFCCHLLGSLDFHHSSRFSHSTTCKQSVVCSISGGLTMGSSRRGPIAQHKASSNRLVKLESR